MKMNRRESSRSRSFSRSRSPSSVKIRSRSSNRRRKSITTDRHRSIHNRYSRERNGDRPRSRTPHRRNRYSDSRSRSCSTHEKRSYDRRKSYSRSPLLYRRRHISSREHPHQSRCLGVFGLSVSTTEQDIYQIFSKFGLIERVQVIIDAKTGKSRGFCFVYFVNAEEAKVAKEQCSGMEVDSRRIRVDYSITQRAHTPTPGVYMGKPTRFYKDKEYHDRYREEFSRSGKKSKSPSYYRRAENKRYRYSSSRSRSREIFK